MDRSSIGQLLEAISVNYPNFQKGNPPEAVAREWYRVLGCLELDEAMSRLDTYLEDPNNTKPPKPHDLKRAQSSMRTYEYFTARSEHQWHLEFMKWDAEKLHGRLFDEEGREFVHDPQYEDGYHYNNAGQICTKDGRIFA